jgi:ferric-dicitrate binding protein FerR (iron transport regulator)
MKTILCLVLLLSSFPVLADAYYEITYQKGNVEVTREGKIVAPPIKVGDRIKVSKGGLLVLKGQGEIIKLMGDTIIKPMTTKEGTLIDLVKGAVVSLITKKAFNVRTKSTVFAVRGTQFFVSAGEGKDAWMCVQEGVVNVQKKSKTIDVPAGKGVFVNANEISKPQSYEWTKGINWKMDPKEGQLDHKLNLKYDLLENFYD